VVENEKFMTSTENNEDHFMIINDDARTAKTIAKSIKEEYNEKIDHNEEIMKSMVSQKINLVLTASQLRGPSLRASMMSSNARSKRSNSIYDANSHKKSQHFNKKKIRASHSSISSKIKEDHLLSNALLKEDNTADMLKKRQQKFEEIVEEEEEEPITPKKTFNFTPYLLAIAMGIHATFAGLALGISKDMGSFIGMLMAILCHKWAEAMTIGISFSKHIADVGMKQTMILLAIFSCATPIGIAVGIAMEDVNDLVNSVMMGVSAGTFVFIACSEIIVEEFNVGRFKFAKYMFYLVGMALMSSVYWIEKAFGGED